MEMVFLSCFQCSLDRAGIEDDSFEEVAMHMLLSFEHLFRLYQIFMHQGTRIPVLVIARNPARAGQTRVTRQSLLFFVSLCPGGDLPPFFPLRPFRLGPVSLCGYTMSAALRRGSG
jgi:hypothetical protein